MVRGHRRPRALRRRPLRAGEQEVSIPETALVGVAAVGRDAERFRFEPLRARVSQLEIIPLRLFLRGDCNDDGNVNVADAGCSLNWMFGGAIQPGCLASLNTNGDGDVNIADPVALLNFLFGGGPSPVAPFPDCGPGMLPADVELGCETPPDCQ